MSYRPITDCWILGRAKYKNGIKYWGGFPSGFLHRARALLGVGIHDPVLHVCGGRVRDYPYRGIGPEDRTLDLDPSLKPDYLQDARKPFPLRCLDADHDIPCYRLSEHDLLHHRWSAVLIDRPYTREDAEHYVPGPSVLPEPNLLIRNGIAVVPVGGKVGMLDYIWPQPPKNATEVAVITVVTGRNNRVRLFTVFERME